MSETEEKLEKDEEIIVQEETLKEEFNKEFNENGDDELIVHENESDVKKESFLDKIKNYKEKNTKKFYIMLSSVLVGIIALISIIIPVSITARRKSLYSDLLYEMQYFNEDSVGEIDEILDKLPDDYKSVETINAQYTFIKKQANIINDYWTISSSTIGLDEIKSEKIREAYIQLKNLGLLYIQWDLESYLDGVEIEKIIFGTRWESLTGNYYFVWNSYEDSNDFRLETNIPNNKEIEKDYYYTSEVSSAGDNIIFGYENKKDEEDKFNAFKVSNLRYTNSKLIVDVYCYSNDQKYSFTIAE